MKKIVFAVALIFLLALGGMAQNAAKATQKPHEMGVVSDISKMLLDMETRVAEAMKADDWATVASALDERFVGNDESGVTDKAAWLKMMRDIKLSEAAVYDMKVVTFRDFAIVTGKFKGKTPAADGKAMNINVNWMDTWVKRDGKWKIIATSSANAKAM